MAKKKINSYPFYQALRDFYEEKKPQIRRNFKDVSKKILDYNDKSIRSDAFMRLPQFEALEMYVFVKEFLNNQKVKDMFADWYNHKNKFESRGPFKMNAAEDGFSCAHC